MRSEAIGPTRPAARCAIAAGCFLLLLAMMGGRIPLLVAGAATRPVVLHVDVGHRLHVPVTIRELPVPPTAPSDAVGSCTIAVNPHGTGCISAAWGALGSPGFYWNPHYVLLGVTYAGAPTTGSSSVYTGEQVLLISTDGTRFPDGDFWKCLTCGVPFGSDVLRGKILAGGRGTHSSYQYPPPHALPGDTRALVGNGILECGRSGMAYKLADPRCTAQDTRIYPVYWGRLPLGAPLGRGRMTPWGRMTNGREWRLNPDGVHLGWNEFAAVRGNLEEFAFVGRLTLDRARERYVLTHVTLLFNGKPQYRPYRVAPGNRLTFNPVGFVGEFRGWSSDGRSVLGIQCFESDSVDAWATSLATGRSHPLTDHAEYTDPMFMSPDGKWLIAEEVMGTGRMDFLSGMQGIPPITDQLSTTGYVAGLRNNGNRRFFLPWLVEPSRGRSEQINAGAAPDWNAAADPVWLADSTGVVWAENLACGANPVAHQCLDSSEPGRRNSRVMIARFPTLRPSRPVPPSPVSDVVPWGTPYIPGDALPTPSHLPAGRYTLEGEVRGSAAVVITEDRSKSMISSIRVAYHDFSDDGVHVINGTESVRHDQDSPFGAVTFHEDLTLSGKQTGSKMTGRRGFTMLPSVLRDDFQARGTLTTTIDERTYRQPANGH